MKQFFLDHIGGIFLTIGLTVLIVNNIYIWITKKFEKTNQELSEKINGSNKELSKKIKKNNKVNQELTGKINDTEQELTEKINKLNQGLTIKINEGNQNIIKRIEEEIKFTNRDISTLKEDYKNLLNEVRKLKKQVTE